MANSWYVYGGWGDPFVPGSYHRITVSPLCIDGSTLCVIYLLGETDPVPSNPFTGNIITYMANGLATLSRKPGGVGQKPYVYFKNL